MPKFLVTARVQIHTVVEAPTENDAVFKAKERLVDVESEYFDDQEWTVSGWVPEDVRVEGVL